MNQQLIDNNYLHIPNFISKEEANNLASELIEYSTLPGNLMGNDPQAPNSLAKYNFLPFAKLLVKKYLMYQKFYKNRSTKSRGRNEY